MSLKFYYKILILLNFSLNSLFQIIEELPNDNYEDYDYYEQPEVLPDPRIAGGYRPDKLLLAKYIVSLRQRSENEKQFGYTHFCAGSIIAANKILTAAHCFSR